MIKNIQKYIEPQRYEELSELGDDFILELLVALKKSVNEQIAKYNDNIESGNIKEVQFNIHTIKGAVLNVGLNGISEMIIKLNKNAVEGDFDMVQEKFPEFVAKFQKNISEI